MKKAVLILVAGFMAMEAYAQAPDTTSTVVGRKLNFEAPVFGLSERDIKPAWSVVMLDEAAVGLNYMLGIPGEIKPAGIFADYSHAGNLGADKVLLFGLSCRPAGRVCKGIRGLENRGIPGTRLRDHPSKQRLFRTGPARNRPYGLYGHQLQIPSWIQSRGMVQRFRCFARI